MSDFNTEFSIRDNIVVVKTHGYLDDAGGQVLRQKCVDLIGKGNLYFVFNLEGTPVINSTGLSMILDILVQIIDYSEGEAAICGLCPLTKTALTMTGVLTLCESYSSEDEAIEAIKESIG